MMSMLARLYLMKFKEMMKKSVKILLSVATFAYDPYTCSLQNLINPGSCNPNLVPNDEYAC